MNTLRARWIALTLFGALACAAGSAQADPHGGMRGMGGMAMWAEGTDYVPTTGPAIIHQGEMVVPKGISDVLRSGKGGGGATFAPTITIIVQGDISSEVRMREVTDEAVRQLKDELTDTLLKL